MPKYTTEWKFTSNSEATHVDVVTVAEDNWMEGYLGINLRTRYSDNNFEEASSAFLDHAAVIDLVDYLLLWLKGKP
jgi:hypothetical protein